MTHIPTNSLNNQLSIELITDIYIIVYPLQSTANIERILFSSNRFHLQKRSLLISRTDGKWVIQTNDDTLTPEDAACAYKSLSVIERCFRTLKSTQLKLEPVYHRLSRRLEAHVKICVMALLIERVAELACEQSWARIRSVLSRLQATEVHTPSHLFFKRNEASPQLLKILEKLAVPLPNSVLSIAPLPEDTPET